MVSILLWGSNLGLDSLSLLLCPQQCPRAYNSHHLASDRNISVAPTINRINPTLSTHVSTFVTLAGGPQPLRSLPWSPQKALCDCSPTLTPCVISSSLLLPYMRATGFQGLFIRPGTSEGKQLVTVLLPAFSIAMATEFILFPAQHSE